MANGWIAIVVAGCLALGGCAHTSTGTAALTKIDYAQPLPPGQMALRKISPGEYPDFSLALRNANVADLRRAASSSLLWLGRPGSNGSFPYLDIDHARAAATLHAFIEMLDSGAMTGPPDRLNRLITDRFEVYKSLGAPRPEGGGYTGSVLFTGYFTPTYDASLTRAGPYRWPLYRRPDDLVTDASGEGAGRRTPDGKLAPYDTRQQIESGGRLAGHELAWLTSRWNAYVITVQGSARLRLPDQQILEVGYAGTNGYDYSSPGRQMAADGVIRAGDINFSSLKRYFDAHPEAMDKYLWINKRTVFFTERPGGPFGSLNVPVTPFATIATDKKVYPPSLPALVMAPIPAAQPGFAGEAPPGAGGTRPFSGFLFDQDRGGAIRSAGRCDIYMGIGQQAEQISGYQLNAGQLYYFAVKPDLAQRYAADRPQSLHE